MSQADLTETFVSDSHSTASANSCIPSSLSHSQLSTVNSHQVAEAVSNNNNEDDNDNVQETDFPVPYANTSPRRHSCSSTSSDHSATELDPLVSRALHLRNVSVFHAFFSQWRWCKPLVFDNLVTEARDLCACERTYLSSLKLSLFMLVAAAVIYVDVRLPTYDISTDSNRDPSSDSTPPWVHRATNVLCWIFLAFSFSILLVNQANYIHQVTGYLRMKSRVTALKLLELLFGLVALLILVTTILVFIRN